MLLCFDTQCSPVARHADHRTVRLGCADVAPPARLKAAKFLLMEGIPQQANKIPDYARHVALGLRPPSPLSTSEQSL